MTEIDRRSLLGIIVGVTAVAGSIAATTTIASALPMPSPATREGHTPDNSSANAATESAPKAEKVRWRFFGFGRRRRYGRGYGRRGW